MNFGNKIMLGVAYYPEHYEENKIESDLKIFKENGIEIIRIGEFAWDIFESEEGKFSFGLFDKVFEIAEKLDIKIIFGTPSATPPAWLIRKYPEILQKNRDGTIRNFGSRRHYCYSSDIYKDYILKLLEKIVLRYKDSKVLYSWQIDNEFGCEGTTYCYCEKCDQKFREYLKEKYGDIEKLNKAWGTVFWSQRYNDFWQIETPKQTNALPNPHQFLDFFKFTTKNIVNFSKFQTDFIRRYSNKSITHNFMVNFTEIDYYELSKEYDFISYDSYIPVDNWEPAILSMNYSLMYSLKNKPFTIMELQPGRVNWQKRNWYYPAEILNNWIYQGFLNNANDILVFRDKALSFGAEQYHNGILNYDGAPENSERLKILRDFNNKKIENEIKKIIKEKDNNLKVGIYFDYENSFIHNINGVCRDFSYIDEVFIFYSLFRKYGFLPQFFFKEEKDLNRFDIIIIPYSIHLNSEIKNKIQDFKNYLIVTCMTDLKDEYNHINLRDSLIKKFRNIEYKILDFGGAKDYLFEYNNKKLKGNFWVEKLEYKGKKSIFPFLISYDKKTLYISSVFDIYSLNEILLDFLPISYLPIKKLLFLKYDGNKIIKSNSEENLNLNKLKDMIDLFLQDNKIEYYNFGEKIILINYEEKEKRIGKIKLKPFEILII